ncbi:MAG: hypothetical protein H3C34_29320, partial [Caldilineaceae bacterium]|nr:hypothetical protein [Caldilineaceae bacterium]
MQYVDGSTHSGTRAYRPIAANIDLLYIRHPQRYAVLILVAYVVAATLFAVTTPPWQNPDEPAHYNYIAHIAAGRGLPVLQHGDYDQSYIGRLVGAGFPDHLPVDSLRYESYQPPLYYLAAAPIYMLGAGQLLPLRLFNVVLGAASILLLFACLNAVFPTKPLITVGATAFAAFLPMHVAMSAAVNNDGLAELLLLAVFLMLLRWMKARFHRVERTPDRRVLLAVSEQQHFLGLGVLLGLGMLSKIYAYLALPLCLGVVLLVVWLQPQIEEENPIPLRPTRHSFAAGIVACLWIGVPALLLVLPLWMRNVVLYGAWDVLGLRIHDAVVIGQPMTSAWIADKGWIEFLDRAVSFTFRSFWGVFGWMGVFMEPRIYALLMIFSGVLFSGLLWALVRFICGRPEADMDRFQFWVLGLFAVMSLVVLASYVGYNAKFVQHQGRYLFWGLLPISTFAALAWRELM